VYWYKLVYLPSLSAIKTVACIGAIRLASGAERHMLNYQSLWLPEYMHPSQTVAEGHLVSSEY